MYPVGLLVAVGVDDDDIVDDSVEAFDLNNYFGYYAFDLMCVWFVADILEFSSYFFLFLKTN